MLFVRVDGCMILAWMSPQERAGANHYNDGGHAVVIFL